MQGVIGAEYNKKVTIKSKLVDLILLYQQVKDQKKKKKGGLFLVLLIVLLWILWNYKNWILLYILSKLLVNFLTHSMEPIIVFILGFTMLYLMSVFYFINEILYSLNCSHKQSNNMSNRYLKTILPVWCS